MEAVSVHAKGKPFTSQAVVVAIGASEGMETLMRLVAQFPPDFPGAVFIVHHMSADTNGEELRRALDKSGPLHCTLARDGEKFQMGRIYLAPPDQHMLVGKGKIMVTKGARENHQRPAIDPLFRSAAVAFGNRVIGIVLTGYLDDGTAGLVAIQRCGGKTIVQDPTEAAYADMPLNALAQVDVDHVVPLAEMGAILTKISHDRRGKARATPRDIVTEAKVAEQVLSDLKSVESLGEQVPFNCPGCGGVLWQMDAGNSLRYRCHTGHSFTAPVLLAEQTAKIEETLWIGLRMLEERRNLLLTMSKFKSARVGKNERPGAANRAIFASAAERAKDSEVHIKRIRALLKAGEGRASRPRSPSSNGG